ncbi:MAG: hypothetical protein HWQ38_34275 [Nostoc sp. NMS7]|uniref:hypothetical protein n=1 Tax=Nostoc sp. NMS7 TaxID=2815391 RepID=UPI0025E94741|nr:hypothetical protein [Nostoc sp. NMS7]MBN3951269.1 hypothetical protein [Nostoc sp. NMS7]
MNKNFITHPQTKERLCKKEWAAKLGITRTTFSLRLKKHPLVIALTPGRMPSGRDVWSAKEEAYLIDIHRTPNLYKRWNRLAKIRGWKPRSHDALNGRITLLKREGAIDGRRNLDESAGWLSLNQLRHCLCISEDPVHIWIRQGLKVTREGSSYKIHLRDFAIWACTIEGAPLVAKAVNGNAIAGTWLLVQIGNWMPEAKKSRNRNGKRNLEVA